MFVGAALSLSPFSLARGEKDQDQREARAAVLSGVEYAMARLQANPSWRAQPAYSQTSDPDFLVQENQGNVVGLVRASSGRFAQFRFSFNWENGTPNPDPDQMGNSSSPLNLGLFSLNNVDQPADFTVPATANRPALVVPAHSIYLAVQGRAGNACSVLSSTNLNPALSSNWGVSQITLRTVYRISNPGQIADPAVGMSGGDTLVQLAASTTEYLSLSGSMGQAPKWRSKSNLQVNGGDSGANFRALSQGQYRLPTGTNAQATGTVNMVRGADESPTDSFYNLSWSDVRKASGSNTLAAGTYVWFDDGSLHYYDMSPSDYVPFIQSNPANIGVEVYNQSEGTKALASGVNVTSTGSGASMKGSLLVHKDTAVTSATNTSELGVLPEKGAAEKPDTGGTGTGTTPEFKDWLLSGALTSAGNPTQFTLSSNPDVEGFFHQVALWGSSNGYGSYGGGNWNLGPVSMQVGIGSNNVNIPPGQWGNFQDAVNGFLSSGSSQVAVVLPLLQAQLALSQAGGGSNGTVSGSTSQVEPKNLEVSIQPSGSASSAILSGDDSITLGAIVKGQGASIVSGKDVKLVGLGVNMSANPNPSEGVSLYARNDIFISTFNAPDNTFNNVALRGVVYAQGNIKTLLGHNSLDPSTQWGDFKVDGSLVAYGGDPASQNPGQAGTGSIDITARKVGLTFDPSFLATLMGTLPGNLTYGRWLWVLE